MEAAHRDLSAGLSGLLTKPRHWPGYSCSLVDEHTLAVRSTSTGTQCLVVALSEQGVQVLSMRNRSKPAGELFLMLVDENADKGGRLTRRALPLTIGVAVGLQQHHRFQGNTVAFTEYWAADPCCPRASPWRCTS